MFKGPVRPRYTVAQFAESYEVTPERVVMWVDRGFLQAAKDRPSLPVDRRIRIIRIDEHARLYMERRFGVPDTPKSTLP